MSTEAAADDCDHCFCGSGTGLNSPQCEIYGVKCCICGEIRSVHDYARELRAARLSTVTEPQ